VMIGAPPRGSRTSTTRPAEGAGEVAGQQRRGRGKELYAQPYRPEQYVECLAYRRIIVDDVDDRLAIDGAWS
jgi:hypothetical protein